MADTGRVPPTPSASTQAVVRQLLLDLFGEQPSPLAKPLAAWPKFALTYEPAGKQPGRSADFAVTFRTHTNFHVEVTRLSVSQLEQQFQAGMRSSDVTLCGDQLDALQRNESRRLADVVCDKIEQLAPDVPNVVWSESSVIRTLDVGQVMGNLCVLCVLECWADHPICWNASSKYPTACASMLRA